MQEIGIEIPRKNNFIKVIYIKARNKRDFYSQVRKYRNWSLFAWYYRHKWFR